MPKIKAAIFDMDGLMFQTEHCYVAANKELGSRRGKVFDERWVPQIMGRTGLEVMKVFKEFWQIDDRPEDLLEERTGIVKAIIERDALPCAGLYELLKQLEHCRIPKAVATASLPELAQLLLGKFGLFPRFSAVVTAAEVKRGKPSPDLFLRAAERLGASPEDCAVLEDAPNGIAAAKAGGFFAVLVPNNYSVSNSEPAPDFTASRLDDLGLWQWMGIS